MPHFYYFMNGSGDVCCMLSIWHALPISFPVILQQPYEVGNIIILESKTVCLFTVPHDSWVAECRFEPRPLTWENVVLTSTPPSPARCLWGLSSAALLDGAAMEGSLQVVPRFSSAFPTLDPLWLAAWFPWLEVPFLVLLFRFQSHLSFMPMWASKYRESVCASLPPILGNTEIPGRKLGQPRGW